MLDTAFAGPATGPRPHVVTNFEGEFTRYSRVFGAREGRWYDLTDGREESLEVEEGEEALLQWAHSGKTGEGGGLPLALSTGIEDQSFSDAG
jgi:hypothetical protein